MLAVLFLSSAMVCACGGSTESNGATTPPAQKAARPTITTASALNGAVIVTLADSTNGAKIYYTLDGSTPTETSQIYEAPFLVTSSMTVSAMAANPPSQVNSAVATQAFTPKIASGSLVWSDEFSASGNGIAEPDAKVWTYDVGTNCCGNNELETYCAWGSSAAPCNPSNSNAYLGTDGYLHLVAQNPSAGVYTSARLKSQGLFSFMYGRVEARMKLPESQGMWPAFWLLGNNIATLGWPACGELDIMEHINGNNSPFSVGQASPGYDWIAGSVHGGTNSNHSDGTEKYHPSGFSAADWHTYGMIWTKGQIQFYVDSPSNVYATFKSVDSAWASNPWPFDAGPQFIILNLAVGGDWPGSPDKTTVFPSDMSVDYVRIYTN